MIRRTIRYTIKYTLCYLTFNLLPSLLFIVILALIQNINVSEIQKTLEPGPWIHLYGFIIWFAFLGLMFYILRMDALKDMAYERPVYPYVISLLIAVAAYIAAGYSMAGHSYPIHEKFPLFSTVFLPHSALAYVTRDCFTSIALTAAADFVIFFFIYKNGRDAYRKKHPVRASVEENS